MVFQEKGFIELDLDRFKRYSKYGNFEIVRVTAMRCYIRLGLRKFPEIVLPFIIDILKNDPSPWVKFKLVDSILSCIPSDFFNQDNDKTNERIKSFIKEIYSILNSDISCYDMRLRYYLLLLYDHIGGNRISNFSFKPIIQLPTRPISRSKLKRSGSSTPIPSTPQKAFIKEATDEQTPTTTTTTTITTTTTTSDVTHGDQVNGGEQKRGSLKVVFKPVEKKKTLTLKIVKKK